MAKYRKIATRIWNDARVRCFSDKAKLAFLFLLTHPAMTPLGAIRARVATIASELGWSGPAAARALKEITDAGIAIADLQAGLIIFPNFFKYNRPESPNVVRSWAGAYDDLPECPLRQQLLCRVEKLAGSLGPNYASAFAETFTQPDSLSGDDGAATFGTPASGEGDECGEDLAEASGEGCGEGAGSPGEGLAQPLAEPLREGCREGCGEGCPHPSPNQEQEQEQEEESPHTPQGARGRGGGMTRAARPDRDFRQLRDFWNANMRAEGPLAGFNEYRAIKTPGGPWPGLEALTGAAVRLKAAGAWNPGYEPGLASFLRVEGWKAPIPERRHEDAPRVETDFQRRNREYSELLAEGLALVRKDQEKEAAIRNGMGAVDGRAKEATARGVGSV